MTNSFENIKKKLIEKILGLFEQNIIELFEQKHLYQNVKIDISEIDSLISSFTYSDFFGYEPMAGPCSAAEMSQIIDNTKTVENNERNKTKEIIYNILNSRWNFVIKDEHTFQYYDKNLCDINELIIPLPTIKINCNNCDSIIPAHNPGFIRYKYDLPNLMFENESRFKGNSIQLFVLPYQCQSCKSEPIIFMVYRKGFKLQIVGRSQFENVSVPKFIPAEESKYYSDAVIAFNTGFILASLYYLRALIEQYMRRILYNYNKISGDELGAQYSKMLDSEFPSLKTVYSELSDKLHKFENSEKQFRKSIADIEKHFDLLQHFPIDRII